MHITKTDKQNSLERFYSNNIGLLNQSRFIILPTCLQVHCCSPLQPRRQKEAEHVVQGREIGFAHLAPGRKSPCGAHVTRAHWETMAAPHIKFREFFLIFPDITTMLPLPQLKIHHQQIIDMIMTSEFVLFILRNLFIIIIN